MLLVMAPVPEDENMRVLGRAKKASKQLQALPSTANAGILCVELGEAQEGADILDQFERKFARNQFSGISEVMLSKRRTIMDPPRRTVIDLLEVKANPNAKNKHGAPLRVSPFGLSARLTVAEPHTGGIRAYRFAETLVLASDPAVAQPTLPDERVLTPFLIA